MENSPIKIDFSYTDEFGQESRLTKSFNESVFVDRTGLEFLVDEFKLFLLVAGYCESNVNSVKIVDY